LALLKQKLFYRSPEQYEKIKNIRKGKPNDLFFSVSGKIEKWEKIKNLNL